MAESSAGPTKEALDIAFDAIREMREAGITGTDAVYAIVSAIWTDICDGDILNTNLLLANALVGIANKSGSDPLTGRH